MYGHWNFCSVSGQLTSRQRFFWIPLTKSSLSLCWGTLCICWPCLQHSSCILLRLRFLFAQSLRVWQRWEIRCFSDLFLAWTSPKYAHGILDSREYVGTSFSKPSMDLSFPSFSFKIFWSGFCKPPTGNIIQVTTILDNYCWFFSRNNVGMGLFLQRELWVKLNKDKVTPRIELFSMLPATSNGVSFLSVSITDHESFFI